MAKRVLVCGGRNYTDYHAVYEVMNGLNRSAGVSVLIQGGALGADRFARRWAQERGVETMEFQADWKSYGRSAGPIRNQKMIDEGRPDLVIAFPGGTGTANMVAIARRSGVPTTEISEHEVNKVDVLDHGFVRLVDSMGGDLSIARAARVSYDAAWRAGENEGSDQRLIGYLWRNHHTTPFESVTLTFEIKAPIFVFRQWHRHRTWSYNELSARYRELPEEFYVPDPDKIGAQSKANKQGRTHEPVDGAADLAAMMRRASAASFEVYRALLESGVARELARSVLPVSTYSHMFATVDLLNLLRFLTRRCDTHAQYEIRVYADAMRDLTRLVAPVAIAAWEDIINGP